MKPVFGIDITENKKNEELNGSEFITTEVEKEDFDSFLSKQDALDETIEESKLPLKWRVLKLVCGALGLMIAAAVVRVSAKTGFSKVFQNAPFLILLPLILLGVWYFLHFLSKKKEKEIFEEKDADGQAEKLDKDVQSLYESLGVPAEAVAVDVLMFTYKLKNGEPVACCNTALAMTPYMNPELRAYVKDDALCLADLENVHSFKLSELKAIKTVAKRISVASWNKEEEPTKGIYKSYKMTVNDYGCVFFKPYHILELEHEGQTWGIYFPCYELSTFEELTGLRAEETKK